MHLQFLTPHFQSLWSKGGLPSTLRSRPAVLWRLESNIGAVASVKSTTETNETFRGTLKLLIFKPVHIFAPFATPNLRTDGHCRDMKLLCTNECVLQLQPFFFSFRGAAPNWWICWETVCAHDRPWRAEVLDLWHLQQGVEPQARSDETCWELSCGDQSLYLSTVQQCWIQNKAWPSETYKC